MGVGGGGCMFSVMQEKGGVNTYGETSVSCTLSITT